MLYRKIVAILSLSLLLFCCGFTNIAHRGDNENGKYAEHSWLAYDRALAEGSNYLELDLQKTADGVLVVSHDDNLSRVFGINLNIGKSNYQQLTKYNNQSAEPIHTLQQIFARYQKNPHIKFMLETKNEGSATGMEKELVDLVNHYHLQKRILFESFSLPSLKVLSKLAPNIPRTQLAGNYQTIGKNQVYANGFFSAKTAAYLQQRKKATFFGELIVKGKLGKPLPIKI